MYSASDRATGIVRGSWDKTKTNAEGEFRVVPATPGDGVLWIKPEKYATQALRIADRRGDWGTLTMQPGKTVSGRVLDVQGEPVPGVRVEARSSGDGDLPDELLRSDAVANQIGRMTTSGLDGRFTLLPLPDGDYTMQVRSPSNSYAPPPLKQVFLRQKFSLGGSAMPASLEIAVPHVVIRGTVFDSWGKPRSGFESTLFGRMDGNFYAEEGSVPGADGKFEIWRHSVCSKRTSISFRTSSVHYAGEWRDMRHSR